jgi:hypothetical protein
MPQGLIEALMGPYIRSVIVTVIALRLFDGGKPLMVSCGNPYEGAATCVLCI